MHVRLRVARMRYVRYEVTHLHLQTKTKASLSKTSWSSRTTVDFVYCTGS